MTGRLMIYLGYYLANFLALKDPLAFAITAPMMALVVFNVAALKDRYFTFWDMVHFLMYLFFVIEPMQAVDHGHIGVDGPVSRAAYSTGVLVTTAAAAFIFYLMFTLVMRYVKPSSAQVEQYVTKPGAPLFIVGVMLAALILYIKVMGGLDALFMSRYDRLALQTDSYADANGALSVIAAGVLMGCSLMLATIARRTPAAWPYLAAALAISAVCFNPFNAARFILLCAYVPILLVLFRGKIRAISVYTAAMLGIVVLMPILDISTRYGVAGFDQHASTIVTDVFSLRFIDVFDMLAESVDFVQKEGYYYGSCLTANLVVFMPRSAWPGKPLLCGVVVGNEVFDQRLYGTANLSQIIAADAYIDFGLIGVAICGIVVGVIAHLLFRQRRLFNGHDLLAYVCVAALPILLRGPMGAVLSGPLFQCLTIYAFRKVLARKVPVASDVEPAGLGISEVRPAVRTRLSQQPHEPAIGMVRPV
jgi:oligosaccharide repeat unit polymerase